MTASQLFEIFIAPGAALPVGSTDDWLPRNGGVNLGATAEWRALRSSTWDHSNDEMRGDKRRTKRLASVMVAGKQVAWYLYMLILRNANSSQWVICH